MRKVAFVLPLLMASVVAGQDAPKARVYVSDSVSWEQSGAFAGADGRVAGFSSGGARPQTAELVRTFRVKATPSEVDQPGLWAVL